jgi:hypothetical protein
MGPSYVGARVEAAIVEVFADEDGGCGSAGACRIDRTSRVREVVGVLGRDTGAGQRFERQETSCWAFVDAS